MDFLGISAVYFSCKVYNLGPNLIPVESADLKSLMTAGNWNEALRVIDAAGQSKSFAFHSNRGLVLANLGRLSEAKYEFEKAETLRPWDRTNQKNYDWVLATLKSQTGVSDFDPSSRFDERLASSPWALPLLLVLIVLTVLQTLRVVFSKSNLRKSRAWTAFALAATSSLGALVIFLNQLSPLATVKELTVVRSGPGDHYLDLGSLPTGLLIRLTGERLKQKASQKLEQNQEHEWVQIRFSEDGIGWVKESILLPM